MSSPYSSPTSLSWTRTDASGSAALEAATKDAAICLRQRRKAKPSSSSSSAIWRPIELTPKRGLTMTG